MTLLWVSVIFQFSIENFQLLSLKQKTKYLAINTEITQQWKWQIIINQWRFIQFQVENFYLSSSIKLSYETTQYASLITEISYRDKVIINHSRNILTKLSNIKDKHNIGLYHDDSFGVFENFFGSQIEHRSKEIMKTFKDSGLSITITSSITSVVLSNVQKTKQRPAIYWY